MTAAPIKGRSRHGKWQKFDKKVLIDFQKINFTRQQGRDNTCSISLTDNAVKLFFWKSIIVNGDKDADKEQPVSATDFAGG